MNRRQGLIIFLFLLVPAFSFSQAGYLFVKKGAKKKRTYIEGDAIGVYLLDGSFHGGIITLLRNDTVFINGQPIPRPIIKEVILKRKPKQPPLDPKTLALIGGGAALTTAGLTISKQAKFEEALVAGLVIGFGSLVVERSAKGFFRLVSRKKFRIGKKYRLQVLDFHLSPLPLKSF